MTSNRTLWAGFLVMMAGSACVAQTAEDVPGERPNRQPVSMVAIDSLLRPRAVEVVSIETAKNGQGFTVQVMEEGKTGLFVLGGEYGESRIIALAPASWGKGTEELRGRGGKTAVVEQPVESKHRYRGWVTLVDGQRLPGEIGGYPTDSESLLWISGHGPAPLPGRVMAVNIPLERVSLVDLSPTSPRTTGADAANDLVVLANGDRLEGFVEMVSTFVRLEPSGGESREIPAGQIARVMLANPLEPGAPEGGTGEPVPSTVWLADGSVLRVTGVDEETFSQRWLAMMDEETRREVPSGVRVQTGFHNAGDAEKPAMLSYPLDEIVSVEAKAGNIRAVSSLEVVSYASTGERRRTRPPKVEGSVYDAAAFGARDITLGGPMQVEWALPSGASMVSGTLVMPRTAWEWGDCTVRVSIVNADGTAVETVGEGRLSRETPTLNYSGGVDVAKAEGARLRVTVEAGERGPIEDVVVVREAIVLVDSN